MFAIPILSPYCPEKEISILNENGIYKRKKNVDRHGSKPLLIDRHLAEPPPLSLYTTFNMQIQDILFQCSHMSDMKYTAHSAYLL